MQKPEPATKWGDPEPSKGARLQHLLTAVAMSAHVAPGAEALVGGGRTPAGPTVQAGAQQTAQRLLLLTAHT